jgi:hypothetical protein
MPPAEAQRREAPDAVDVLALDEALTRLASLDADLAKVGTVT